MAAYTPRPSPCAPRATPPPGPGGARPPSRPPAPPRSRFPSFSFPLPGRRRSTPADRRRVLAGRPRPQPALSRLDRERARERLTVIVLSAIVGLCVVVVEGPRWERVTVPQRPVAGVMAWPDHPAGLHRRSWLIARMSSSRSTSRRSAWPSSRPPPPGAGGGEEDFMRQFAQQRLNAIQNQLAGLSTELRGRPGGRADRPRAAAAQRGITATPAEIDAESTRPSWALTPLPRPPPPLPLLASTAGRPVESRGGPSPAQGA